MLISCERKNPRMKRMFVEETKKTTALRRIPMAFRMFQTNKKYRQQQQQQQILKINNRYLFISALEIENSNSIATHFDQTSAGLFFHCITKTIFSHSFSDAITVSSGKKGQQLQIVWISIMIVNEKTKILLLGIHLSSRTFCSRSFHLSKIIKIFQCETHWNVKCFNHSWRKQFRKWVKNRIQMEFVNTK